MDAKEARTIGRRLRAIRKVRDKTLEEVAGRAGTSTATLSRIETGKLPLDNLTMIVALANALEIAPSELTRLPVPAPANGHTDSTTEAVRLALDAIDVERPGGIVLPLAVLRDQVAQIHRQRRACQFAEVATDLPGLIRNLHTTLATGADRAELLDLGVYLHVHVTRFWLIEAVAPDDLLRRVAFLARRLAQERDEATTLAFASFAVADVLLCGGAFELGQAEADSITLPPTTAGTAGLVGQVAALHAHAAQLNGRPGDVAAAFESAAELAERFGATGATDSVGYLFGPVDLAMCRMARALNADEPDQAASIARGVDPERHPFPVNRTQYWIHCGRALSRLRGRRDEAVTALRTAEDLFPTRVHRDPVVREVLAVLLTRVRRDAVSQELRRMAFRAGLTT
ncbi:MAG: helix-turn-helix domain-containing protein [Pseudonocardiaceae bacterium]